MIKDITKLIFRFGKDRTKEMDFSIQSITSQGSSSISGKFNRDRIVYVESMMMKYIQANYPSYTIISIDDNYNVSSKNTSKSFNNSRSIEVYLYRSSNSEME